MKALRRLWGAIESTLAFWSGDLWIVVDDLFTFPISLTALQKALKSFIPVANDIYSPGYMRTDGAMIILHYLVDKVI